VRAIRSGNKELERVYLPLSSLITWAAVLGCGLSICSSLGVNLKPLLAVGGAGGIAAGFASQQLLLNVVAGVNIFLTRPFIAGDQVGCLFGGGRLRAVGGGCCSGKCESGLIVGQLCHVLNKTLLLLSLSAAFLHEPQVVFEGGANIEGTVEGVEITRTMLVS
jgi:small-conductance mechanosensitive channel